MDIAIFEALGDYKSVDYEETTDQVDWSCEFNENFHEKL